MTARQNGVRFFVTTDAPCDDPAPGTMLDDYLDERLAETDHSRVHLHLKTCLRCSAYVSNSEAIRAAQTKEQQCGPRLGRTH